MTERMGQVPLPLAPEPGSRWAVGGIVAMLGGFAVALVVTSWLNYSRTEAVGELIARGQGEGLIHGVIAGVSGKRQVSAARLEAVLGAERSHGLRFVAVVEDGVIVASAGASAEPATVMVIEGKIDAPGSFPMRRLGERWRATAPRSAPPGGGPPPGGLSDWLRGPPGRDDGPPPPAEPEEGATASLDEPPPPDPDGPPLPGAAGSPPRPRRPPPQQASRGVFVLEFEPVVAAELRGHAARALGVGIASALALLLAAGLLWRWVRHRERLERRLAHERRLASLGQMSAVLAHEIRNPLASLKGHAQLLVEDLEGRSEHAGATRVVDEAVRLERLTQDLLEFVRTGRIERRACAPGELLVAAAGRAGIAAVEVADAPATWSLDPERIGQVLANLLDNARQAGPADAVRARAALDGGALIYEVRDGGRGLPADGEQIFEPFHTTRVHGVGLGLAVARRLVELHGGTLTARTEPAGGAAFTVRIPRGSKEGS